MLFDAILIAALAFSLATPRATGTARVSSLNGSAQNIWTPSHTMKKVAAAASWPPSVVSTSIGLSAYRCRSEMRPVTEVARTMPKKTQTSWNVKRYEKACRWILPRDS